MGIKTPYSLIVPFIFVEIPENFTSYPLVAQYLELASVGDQFIKVASLPRLIEDSCAVSVSRHRFKGSPLYQLFEMCSKILISIRNHGACKLVSCDENTLFSDFINQVRGRWSELSSTPFNCICQVGDFTNVGLDCDDDLKNLITLCELVSTRIVNAEICLNGNPCTSHISVETNSHHGLQPSRKKHISVKMHKSGKNPGPNKVMFVDDNIDDGVLSDESAFDMPPSDSREPLLSDDWVNIMKGGVGAVFRGGAKQFRLKLIKYTLKSGFRFIFNRNDSRYIHVVCYYHDSNCDWFIKARADKTGTSFVVFKANMVHNCVGNLIGTDTKRLGPRMVGDFILSDVKDKPTISSKTVIQKMKNLYGIDIPYWKAYRAVERARESIFGTFDQSYDDLRWYCNAVERTNPRSVVTLQCNQQTNCFERLFIAFKACIEGFRSCRPMIFIDGTFLKGRSKGTLLSATTKDGNSGLYPVAFAIVSAENNDNWTWFLQMLKGTLNHHKQILYFSNRHLGIINAFNEVFNEPVHFFCLYHLLSNLKGHFSMGWTSQKRENLGHLFRECAYAEDTNKFELKLHEFKKVGGKLAEEWVEQLPFEKWAVSYAPNICRYGEMTSNAAESFNAWILDARSLPVAHMVEEIRSKISGWFVKRRALCDSWNGALVGSKQELWNKYVEHSSTWNVVACPSGVFKVESKPSVVVDLNGRSCSCSQWQLRGFPCVHGVAVICVSAQSIYPHVEECFFTTSYKKCYSTDLHPIPDTEKSKFPKQDGQPKILPPCLGKRPGRPKRSRNASYGEYRKSKKSICQRCGKLGRHDKLTCRQVLEDQHTPPQSYHPSPVNEVQAQQSNGVNGDFDHIQEWLQC